MGTAVAALAVGAVVPTAQAAVPRGQAFTDLAPFSEVTCRHGDDVLAHDLIVNPGGGNVAWLPDGTRLVGTSFSMYDANGDLLLTKAYGRGASPRPEVVCTTVGTDPDSGARVTVIFSAVTTP
jgi:hypothetical protein